MLQIGFVHRPDKIPMKDTALAFGRCQYIHCLMDSTSTVFAADSTNTYTDRLLGVPNYTNHLHHMPKNTHHDDKQVAVYPKSRSKIDMNQVVA